MTIRDSIEIMEKEYQKNHKHCIERIKELTDALMRAHEVLRLAESQYAAQILLASRIGEAKNLIKLALDTE